MPAGSRPETAMPSRYGKNTDVKTPQENSSTPEAQETQAPIEAKAQIETEAPNVDEADIKALEEEKKVPYNRFKEVNEKAKNLQAKLREAEERQSELVRRASEDAETRIRAKLEKERQDQESMLTLDPWEKSARVVQDEVHSVKQELQQLKAETASARLKSTLQSLEQKYPEGDALAVLGWAKSQGVSDPDSLEELMEKSHNRNLERVQSKLNQILESKKVKAKSAMPVRESAIKLKESERPKTLKEAGKLLRKLYSTGQI